MKALLRPLMAATFITVPLAAHALEVGESDFIWVSDLAHDGFEPFAVSSSSKVSFGMMKGTDMYLCSIADNKEHQEIRRNVVIANMDEDKSPRAVPNIPVVCVLAQ